MRHLVGVFLFFLLLSCSQVNQAQESVDALTFDSLLTHSDSYTLVDVRTREEFEGGSIENAINIDFYSDSIKSELLRLPKEKPVFLYCLSGGRSSKAAKILKANSYQVIELKGGIAAWRNASLPVEGGVGVVKQISKTREQFFSELDSNHLYLVDFNAKWCLPCRQLLPIAEKLDSTFSSQLSLIKVDYDSNRQLAQDFKVEGLPYLLLIRNGKVLWSNFGLVSEEELKIAIEQWL